MKERLNEKKVANTLAVTAGIISLVCYILILIVPVGTISFFGAIFHGIDLSKIAVESISIGNGLLGVVEAIILGWIIGWLFAKIYNSMK
ncbi:hypothetical protein J4423_03495 [Candidatus Pacearchaeota archaeon]|nr:hypothetical protein [Candidatus Pacearchaeota archaeon]